MYHTSVWFSSEAVFNIEKKNCCGTMFLLSPRKDNKGTGVVLIVISVNLITTNGGFLTTLYLCILSSAIIFLWQEGCSENSKTNTPIKKL